MQFIFIPSENRLQLRFRLLIAIPLAIALIAAAVMVFFPGVLVAAFSTDACHDLPDWPFYYLYIVWPLVMLISALIPSILVMLNFRWIWTLISIPLGVVASIGAFLLWFPILGSVC